MSPSHPGDLKSCFPVESRAISTIRSSASEYTRCLICHRCLRLAVPQHVVFTQMLRLTSERVLKAHYIDSVFTSVGYAKYDKARQDTAGLRWACTTTAHNARRNGQRYKCTDQFAPPTTTFSMRLGCSATLHLNHRASGYRLDVR